MFPLLFPAFAVCNGQPTRPLSITHEGASLPPGYAFVLMREMGLEPTRAYTHKILSLACLPIPALPLNG